MGGRTRFHRIFNNLVLVLLFSLICATISYASAPTVIANSKDWKDVYSSMVYANLQGYPSYFITTQSYGRIVLTFVQKDSEKIITISSPNQAYLPNYGALIESLNFEVEEITSSNVNLELARRLNNINNYIIIDDAYGYNAVSVASYAVVSKSYVLFANSRNIGQVADFLRTKTTNRIIIYGQVDREVKNELAGFNAEIINEGDRFDDNLKLVDKYLQLKPRQQVILTNGEFLESSLMLGDDPVIFIGKSNVPDVVRSYISKSDFKVAILIGNELIGPAQFIRRQIGISVFVKFAQGARTPTGAVSTVEDLDRYILPRYQLNIDVYQIQYNQLTRQLEVTYRNRVEQAAYILPTISVNIAGLDITANPNEKGVLFLDGNGYKTILYDINITQDELVDAIANIYVLYGEGKRSLEYVYENSTKIGTLSIMDSSSIDVQGLVYDKYKKGFIAKIKNNGGVGVYVDVELTDVMINGERVNLGSVETIFIDVDKTKEIFIPAPDFSDADVIDNPMINLRAYYGERERNLYKTVIAQFEFEYASSMLIVYILIGVVIILFLIFEFTRKKCNNCKHKNPIWRKTCVKCGHDLKEK